MRILLSGFGGHMGREVRTLALQGCRESALCAGVDPFFEGEYLPGEQQVPVAASFAEALTEVDCVIDFSHHAQTAALCDFAVKHKLPLVIATTGQTEDEKQAILNAAEQIPLFFAANYSLGIALLIELAKQAAAAFPDAEIEIVETHHDRKLDAPSGTALAIAEALKTVRKDSFALVGRSGQQKRSPQEIGIHSLRLGNVVGTHEVILATQNQVITLKHEALSRGIFAEGALAAAEFLVKQPAGLYTMQNML